MSDERVYAVASGKGGVGKTTTAVNLAAAAAAAGVTTVVVDLDLGMANVGDFLDLQPDVTLHDVLAGDAEPDDALVSAPAGFDVLAGGTAIEDFGRVDPGDLRPVVEALRERYECVLLDTGGGLTHDNAVPLGLADRVILATTPQAAALGNTQKTAELADRLDSEIAGVLLTRVSAGDADTSSASPLEATVLGSIPEDRAVPESQAAGEPLETYAPDAPATQAYRELASRLLDIPLPRNWESADDDGMLSAGLGGPETGDEEHTGGLAAEAGPETADTDAEPGTEGESSADDASSTDAEERGAGGGDGRGGAGRDESDTERADETGAANADESAQASTGEGEGEIATENGGEQEPLIEDAEAGDVDDAGGGEADRGRADRNDSGDDDGDGRGSLLSRLTGGLLG